MTSRPELRVAGAAAKPRARAAGLLVRGYPYEITCTCCEARLVAVDRDWIVLVGPRPIEVIGGLDGVPHIACHRCGTLVAIDGDLLSLR